MENNLTQASLWPGSMPIIVTAIVAWVVHIILYTFYARRANNIRSPKFVALHCLEAFVVFGGIYAIGLTFANYIFLGQLLVAGLVTALADIVIIIFGHNYYRPLVSPANLVLPPLAASLAVIGTFFIFQL